MALLPPKILYKNIINDADTVTADEEAAGFPVEKISNSVPDEPWKSETAGAQNITISAAGGTPVLANAIGILEHNLGDAGAQLIIRGATDLAFTTGVVVLDTINFTNNRPFYGDLSVPATKAFYRYEFTSLSEVIRIGHTALGAVMIMPVVMNRPYDAHSVGIVGKQFSSLAGGSQLGATVRKVLRGVNAQFDGLAESFIENELLPFLQDHLEGLNPFFYKFDLESFLDQVFFIGPGSELQISLPFQVNDLSYSWNLIASGKKRSNFR